MSESVDREDLSSEKSDEIPHFDDEGNEFLQVIDGEPAHPPPYNAVNPNRRVRFPVYEYEETRVVPPAYKPTVSECTVVSVKWEWSTPYEVSPLKSWRNYLMEINSTQLNFYDIDIELTHDIKNYSSGANEVQHSHHLFSMSKGRAYQFNRADQERITIRLQRNLPKYLCPSKMVKSFSLQCAKFGIPTDYTKKTFVLRLRCEQEQFMVNFAHVDDMIMWSVHLQIGIGVSLDLDLREYPNYRVIPRRRRPLSRSGSRNRTDNVSRPGSDGGNIGCSGNSNGQGNGDGNGNSNSNSNGNTNGSGNRFSRPVVPQRSQSVGKLSLAALSSASRDSIGGGTTPTIRSSADPKRAISMEFLPNLHRRHLSTGTVPQFPLNAVRGHKSNCTDESQYLIRSKLKHLFKSDDLPRLVSSRSSGDVSTIPKELRFKNLPPRRPPLLSDDTRPKFRVSDLKSVQEDTETESPPALKSMPSYNNNNNLLRPTARRMVSSPSLSLSRQSSRSNSPMSSVRVSPTPTPTPPNESMSPAWGTSIQKEAEEVQQVRLEYNDPETADLHNRIRISLSNEATEDFKLRSSKNGRGSERSIYLEEGMFYENDDDYIYIKIPYRDGLFTKWNPFIKEPSRGRYIRDSLRCIRPLNDSDKWIGSVVFKPRRPPCFLTNNQPIMYGFMQQISQLYVKGNHWEPVDYKRTKNHYLRPYIVGMRGLVKATTKPHNIYEEV